MESIVEELMAAHIRAEQLRTEARRTLVEAIRKGAAAGMTQREIAVAVGRSQPRGGATPPVPCDDAAGAQARQVPP